MGHGCKQTLKFFFEPVSKAALAMAPNCCVPQCKETGGFLFPKDKSLRRKWQVAIKRQNEQKRLWKPSPHSVVCRNHFKLSDFHEPKVTYGEKRRKVLKSDAVPSIFPFRQLPLEPTSREKRYDDRCQGKSTESQQQGNEILHMQEHF